MIVDSCPHFGHPEADLAMIDNFEPVPGPMFDG